MDRHHTKKTESPPEIRNHGPESGHTKSTSKKAQHGVKRHSSEEYASEENDNSKGYSSIKTSSHSHRRGKKRKHSKSHEPEDFKNAKPPIFNREIRMGKK